MLNCTNSFTTGFLKPSSSKCNSLLEKDTDECAVYRSWSWWEVHVVSFLETLETFFFSFSGSATTSPGICLHHHHSVALCTSSCLCGSWFPTTNPVSSSNTYSWFPLRRLLEPNHCRNYYAKIKEVNIFWVKNRTCFTITWLALVM